MAPADPPDVLSGKSPKILSSILPDKSPGISSETLSEISPGILTDFPRNYGSSLVRNASCKS